MDATQGIIALSALLATAGVLGIAYAVFRSSASTKTCDLYKAENEILGKANARWEAEVARLQTKVDALSNANMVLQETVSGREELRRLAEEGRVAEQERRAEHAAIQMLLKDILAQLKTQRGVIG